MSEIDYVGIVDTFLKTFEARDLEGAATMLTDSPVLVFPPGRQFGSLEELSGGLKRNYEWVKKHRDHYAIGKDTETGKVTVTSRGRLYGVDLDGKEFKDIFYIDFFVFEGDKIAEQHVWNHLAAAGISKPVTD